MLSRTNPPSIIALVTLLAVPLFAIAEPPKFDILDWTPRQATGYAQPWEKMSDPQWDDARFLGTDTGPALNATMRYIDNGQLHYSYKATAIRLGDDGGVMFDRNTLRYLAGWTGGFLSHSPKRFALLNTPMPKGSMAFAVRPGPGWADKDAKWPAIAPTHFGPLPAEWAKYRGQYLHGKRVVLRYTVGEVEVLDSPSFNNGIVRTVQIPAATKPMGLMNLTTEEIAPHTGTLRKAYRGGWPSAEGGEDLTPLTKPGPRRWGEPIVTKLVRGAETGAFAIDTLTLPSENPSKALLFCTGLDFLPDGRIAVCTVHGDVWFVTVDETKAECRWQRFATGLYHPLGLKVVDGKVVVLERGQLTRLHDNNDDGEADYYECINNDWQLSGGEHSYDTCLETDPAGNFHFFKTGDTDTPTGGCLMRVSKDGSKCETVATGFRHPIGMGMSPDGILTTADQEGNWMPATRIDQVKPGGFYGDMRAHHRTVAPTTYDPPLCWIPREIDNSAGGQVWVPAKTFGPLAGLPIHLSYGRCSTFVLLRQELPDGTMQGGVADLGWRFLAGVCRGRFQPKDKNLYVCGLNGWQTAAQADGCLQRVRYTGKPFNVPVKMEVVPAGVKLTFSRALDPASANVVANYRVAAWNYRWTSQYGSKRWKPSNANYEGQDDLPVSGAELQADGKTVLVKLPMVVPVMQMQVAYNVQSADAAAVTGSVFLTVHGTGK